jgi:hypothetical protein
MKTAKSRHEQEGDCEEQLEIQLQQGRDALCVLQADSVESDPQRPFAARPRCNATLTGAAVASCISYSITSSAVASSVARIFGHDDIHIKSDQIACGSGDLFSFNALASALIMTRCV